MRTITPELQMKSTSTSNFIQTTSHAAKFVLFTTSTSPINFNTLGIKQAIVAYSKPKNIGDHVTQAKLHEAAGNTASIIMGEYNLGSNP